MKRWILHRCSWGPWGPALGGYGVEKRQCQGEGCFRTNFRQGR